MPVRSLWAAGVFALVAGPAIAQESQIASTQFSMNTLFMIICTILVMWMTAGFTMLEAGFVRAKNVVNQCAKNLGLFSVASICFLISGYGLLFPGDNWILPGLVGEFGSVNLGSVADDATSFENLERASAMNVMFQMMFAAAVASIISGALAERLRLLPFFVFVGALTGIIYPIQASWTWGGGFLATQFGFVDMAGSTVIHVAGGVAALTGSLVIGARTGRFVEGGKNSMMGSNLPIATLGALILWMGWFGFNAGSYLGFATDADASNVSRIMLNTNLAAAGGVIGAGFISYTRYNRFDLSFMINGALGGLVSITAEPLMPTPLLAVTIGMMGGLIVVWSVFLMEKLRIDDVVGAVPVHLACGIWGTLAVVLTNPEATLMTQLIPMAIVIFFMAATTSFMWLLLSLTMGLRVTSASEAIGTDQAEMVLQN